MPACRREPGLPGFAHRGSPSLAGMTGLSTLLEALVRPTRGPIARRALRVVATLKASTPPCPDRHARPRQPSHPRLNPKSPVVVTRTSAPDRASTGLAAAKHTERETVLATAREHHPERFATTTSPKIITLPDAAWINQPPQQEVESPAFPGW